MPVRAGRPTAFRLHLAGPLGPKPTLRGPRGVLVGNPVGGPDGTTWAVAVPAQDAPQILLAVAADLPAAPRVVLPDAVLWFGVYAVAPSVTALVLDPDMAPVPDRANGVRPAPDAKAGLAARWAVPAERLAKAAVWDRVEDPASLTIRVAPPGGPREGPPAVPPTPPPAKDAADDALAARPGVPWAAAAVWSLGLFVVGWLSVWGHRGWWPERFAGCGLLGLAVVGLDSAAGVVFAGLVLVGWTFRCSWSIGRLTRAVAR